MKFEWDPEKEKKNIKKHGFDFDTATRVFAAVGRAEEGSIFVIFFMVSPPFAVRYSLYTGEKATQLSKDFC